MKVKNVILNQIARSLLFESAFKKKKKKREISKYKKNCVFKSQAIRYVFKTLITILKIKL
jgi:hypothetical protein